MFRRKKKKKKMERKVLSERVSRCHDVVQLCFMLFFYLFIYLYLAIDSITHRRTTQTWIHKPFKPLGFREVPTSLIWAMVLYARFSIRMGGGFTTSDKNVTRQLISNKRLKLAASN